MINIESVTNDQLRLVCDAIVLYRSIRVWNDRWGEYELTEPVMICRLQLLPIVLKVCERLAADLHDPVFSWRDVNFVSEWDLSRLRSHVSLEREVRTYLKSIEKTSV